MLFLPGHQQQPVCVDRRVHAGTEQELPELAALFSWPGAEQQSDWRLRRHAQPCLWLQSACFLPVSRKSFARSPPSIPAHSLEVEVLRSPWSFLAEWPVPTGVGEEAVLLALAVRGVRALRTGSASAW